MRRKIYKSVNVLRKVWRNITDRDLVKLVAVIGTVWILVDFCWTAVNIFDYYTGKNNLEGNRVLWIIVGVLPLTIAAFYFRIIDKNRKLENQNRRLYLQAGRRPASAISCRRERTETTGRLFSSVC